MADFYKRRDVQALLKHRKILFLGDSNVRPLYKDLISAIKRKELISVETLKNPNVESYYGDIAVQQCGRKSEWTFWENRIFEEGPWRVEMFCTGRVLMTEILQYISKLAEVPSSIPDVVYVSFNLSHGRQTLTLVSKLLVDLKMKLPCNTLVLVGSSFPTAKDMFGDPRFDEVAFFTAETLETDEDMEEKIISKVSSIGFHYLNIAHYLRNQVFRGTTTEHGWESVIVRYTTFLLLTYMANSLLIKTPNRVNQDVLHKAIASGNDESNLYNNLLMKQANDWMWVKSQSLNDVLDLAASNAYEITQMLWKIYHRSRGVGSPRRISGRKSRNHDRKETRSIRRSRKTERTHKSRSSKSETRDSKGRSRNAATPSSKSTLCSDSTKGVDAPQKLWEEQKKDAEKQICSHRTVLPVDQEKLNAMKSSSRLNNSPSTTAIQGYKNIKYDEADEMTARINDGESLEEGEIPDSPSESCNGQRLIQADPNYINEILSASSSSEGEIDVPQIPTASFQGRVIPAVSSYHEHHPMLAYDYQNYQTFQIQVPPSAAAQQIQCLDLTANEPAITIEVSDEELVQEEKRNEENNDADEAIISLNSEDESSENKSLHSERIELLQVSSQKEKGEGSGSKYGRKDKLSLMISEGTLISWPTATAKSGSEILWKWWRNHIERNSGLIVLSHPGMEKTHGAIPSLSGKTGKCSNIAVPKIVDDMQQFLTCLEETKFPEFCSDLIGTDSDQESCRSSLNRTKERSEKSFKTAKLLPLAEELSRGSIKRISFEISKKTIPAVPARNRITIKDFASIRSLTAKTRQKSDLDVPREPKGSSSANFYSYGEQVSCSSMQSSDKAFGLLLDHWVASSKTDTGTSKANCSPTLTEASKSQMIKRNSKKSRSEQTNSYEETFSKRRGKGHQVLLTADLCREAALQNDIDTDIRAQLTDLYANNVVGTENIALQMDLKTQALNERNRSVNY